MQAHSVEIEIINIVPKNSGKGEYNRLEQEANRVQRILNHISYLIDLVVEEHKRALQYSSSPNEIITRLVTPEFSFYTTTDPLTFDEYKHIIRELKNITDTLPPNIHFVLSSFPVEWPNKILHNSVLHVQSPRNEKRKSIIHHIYKKHKVFEDPQYPDSKNKYPLYTQDSSMDSGIQEAYLIGSDVLINDVNQYKGALNITTARGQNFLIAIEICIEHANDVAFDNIKQLQAQLGNAHKLVPFDTDLIVTSNTIEIILKNLISGSFVHADPHILFPNCRCPRQTQNKKKLEHTHFGSMSKIVIYEPMKVERLKPYFTMEQVSILMDIKKLPEYAAQPISKKSKEVKSNPSRFNIRTNQNVQKPHSFGMWSTYLHHLNDKKNNKPEPAPSVTQISPQHP